MKTKFVRWGLTALMVGTLAACGGSGGSSAPEPGTTGTTGTTAGTAPAVAVPTGTAPVTLTATTSAATFAALAPTVAVGGVTIASPPCVSFSMADANGNGIIGFGSSMKRSTDAVASYPNLAFSLAKLVPGTSGSPSKWVSYIVTGNPTLAADKSIVAGVPSRPSSDNIGTLTDNKNGTYAYCFYRDVKKVKDDVAAATLTAPNVAADLGDLTYDATLVHRLTIQISGSAPGTGTNTPDGSTSATAAVSMTYPLNVVYDFIPATGKAVDPADATIPQRLIVDKASCNECHAKLGGIPGTDSASFHGGSRYDPKYCVVCHTDQRKYGRTNTKSTNNDFGVDSKGVANSTYVADGVTVGDFPVLIHRVHKGEELIKKNYNFAGVLLNETRFPMDLRNCDKCHDGTAPKVAPQATNYQTVPSRLACGACHDGIDFTTGKGTNNSTDLTTGNHNTWGHIGGAQLDDSKCTVCHDATSIKSVYHVPVTPPNTANSLQSATGTPYTNAAWIASNRDNLPAGAIKVDYDIKSVSRNTSKQPVIVFRLLQNGARTDFNDPTKATEIWTGFFGAPSVYFVWAVPQDNIDAPADFNASANGWIKSLWQTGGAGFSGPDANGYYTATLTTKVVPDNAVMLSGGLGYTYNLSGARAGTPPLTQSTGVSDPLIGKTFLQGRYGVTDSTIAAGPDNKIGGLIVVTPDAQVVASAGAAAGGTGGAYTGRRAIVSDALCNQCHKELGVFTTSGFHAGQRNDGSSCAWCHNPNLASSGWSADSTYFVHAIHAADKRAVPFAWHGTVSADGKSAADGFFNIGYPGILNKCETCHLPGTYDFSATASSTALPNRLYRTVAAGTLAASPLNQPSVGVAGGKYGTAFSTNASGVPTNASGTLVNSPVAGVCASCHDGKMVSDPTQNVITDHMVAFGGGSINVLRETAIVKSEQCILCHGPNSTIAPIKAMHNK